MKILLETHDQYRFHDNKIHGLKFAVEGFKSELHFDIDHILDWPSCADGNAQSLLFSIAKGVLKFADVTDLLIHIDWGNSAYTTSVSGMYIDRVQMEPVKTTLRLPAYYACKLVMNDARSTISFGSSAMFFELLGTPIMVDRQFLTESERNS